MFERFTDRARRVVVLAQDEARMLGHDYIGTEHILLGLIREGEGVGAQVLTRLGADLGRTRQQVIQLLHGFQGREPTAGPPWRRPVRRGGGPADLSGKLDEITGRLAAIERRLGIGQGPAPDPAQHEVERLRALLRTHGIDPGGDPPPPASPPDRSA